MTERSERERAIEYAKEWTKPGREYLWSDLEQIVFRALLDAERENAALKTALDGLIDASHCYCGPGDEDPCAHCDAEHVLETYPIRLTPEPQQP